MNIPAYSGKTTLEDLHEIPKEKFSSVSKISFEKTHLFYEEFEGFRFDYLWRPQVGAKRLFVLFSGDAMRKKNDPPVFQRWSWADAFPGHCLYVSDPSLYLDPKMGLAWYAGTDSFDPMERITALVKGVAERLGVLETDIFSYGSSGGGFAALRMASMMDGAGVLAVNPQTDITAFNMSSVGTFLRVCFSSRSREKAVRDFPERLNLLNLADKFREKRVVYIQNTLDEHHYTAHFTPFCAAMSATTAQNETTGSFRRLLFSHEGGHKKAETPEVFAKAMSIVEEWSA